MLNNKNQKTRRKSMREQSIKGRLEICKKCPIYNPLKGGVCNSNLWLNPETDEVSTYARIGFIRGCNCMVAMKARNLNSHCVAGKW